jgi:hypothetical protein
MPQNVDSRNPVEAGVLEKEKGARLQPKRANITEFSVVPAEYFRRGPP